MSTKTVQFAGYPFKVRVAPTPPGAGCARCAFYQHPGGCPTAREEWALVGEDCLKGRHHYVEVKS